jgi:hypothetical protein
MLINAFEDENLKKNLLFLLLGKIGALLKKMSLVKVFVRKLVIFAYCGVSAHPTTHLILS